MLTPIERQYEEIGQIVRSQGIHGEVVIISEYDVPILFDEKDLVYVQNMRGDLIPARIEKSRIKSQKNQISFFVKFEHVADRKQAEELRGFSVFKRKSEVEPLLKDNPDEIFDLSDFVVFDEQQNIIGTVDDVIDNPAHPILVVQQQGLNPLLIPFVDEYVVEVQESEQRIVCKNIDQLADL